MKIALIRGIIGFIGGHLSKRVKDEDGIVFQKMDFGFTL